MASNNRLLGMIYSKPAEAKEVGSKEYPKMRYHEDGRFIIVADKKEERAVKSRGFTSLQDAIARRNRVEPAKISAFDFWS